MAPTFKDLGDFEEGLENVVLLMSLEVCSFPRHVTFFGVCLMSHS